MSFEAKNRELPGTQSSLECRMCQSEDGNTFSVEIVDFDLVIYSGRI